MYSERLHLNRDSGRDRRLRDGKAAADIDLRPGLTMRGVIERHRELSMLPGFDDLGFVLDHTVLPDYTTTILPDPGAIRPPIGKYVSDTMEELIFYAPTDSGSRLGMRNPGIQPGKGRFAGEQTYHDLPLATAAHLLMARQLNQRPGHNGDAKVKERLVLGIEENLADLQLRLGVIPNGTRTYYADRTQPPGNVLMVRQLAYHFRKPGSGRGIES